MSAPESVTLALTELLPLYGGDLGDLFILVTSPQVRGSLKLVQDLECEFHELSWECGSTHNRLLEILQANSQRRKSVLWVVDDEFRHYEREHLRNTKLGAISLLSDSGGTASLPLILDLVRRTDYSEQREIERRLLSLLSTAEKIRLRTPARNTDAVLLHRSTRHWFSLHGPLGWGDQTVLPTGELSVLTDPSGEFTEARFPLDGEIVLSGLPIVHRSTQEVPLADCKALFTSLASIWRHPVVARVENGVITDLGNGVSGEHPALDAFRRLFAADERYRKIHEIGLGTNRVCRPLRQSNFFANERFPGAHFGLGLGGYTNFHIDLVCTEVKVDFEMADGALIDAFERTGSINYVHQ